MIPLKSVVSKLIKKIADPQSASIQYLIF